MELNLAKIAKRIIRFAALEGERGWLYIDGAKFVPLSDKIPGANALHANFARTHVLEDAGFDKVLDNNKDWLNRLNPNVYDDFKSMKQIFFSFPPDSSITKKFLDEMGMSEDIFNDYHDSGEHVNQTYSKNYNAIRIWGIREKLYAEYNGWNESALRALQQFINKSHYLEVMVSDSSNNKNKTWETDDLLKVRGPRQLLAVRLKFIAHRIMCSLPH